MSRPVLRPGLTALWRGPQTLQIGLDPRQAVVLDLPNPAAAGLLELLDGGRTESAVIAAAARRGIGEPDARALLDTLRRHRLVIGTEALLPRGVPEAARGRLTAEAGALALRHVEDERRPGRSTPAQILRGRMLARVRVTGRGRLGVPIAVSLAAAGVGHVDPALDGTVEPGELMSGESGTRPPHPRSAAAARMITQTAPGTRVSPLTRHTEATLVVQLGPPPGPATLYALAYRRLAHLAVAVRDGTALVGPFVPPGGGPCLNCVDLHRNDRDPVWPVLAAQLATPSTQPVPGRPEACDIATSLAAIAYAVGEVLRYLDGEKPHTLGATMEFTGAGETRRRTWPRHPGCTCGKGPRSPAHPVVTGTPPA